jgi:hypothetical protein
MSASNGSLNPSSHDGNHSKWKWGSGCCFSVVQAVTRDKKPVTILFLSGTRYRGADLTSPPGTPRVMGIVASNSRMSWIHSSRQRECITPSSGFALRHILASAEL